MVPVKSVALSMYVSFVEDVQDRLTKIQTKINDPFIIPFTQMCWP